MTWRTETTVTECFPNELRVSSFPDRFLRNAWTAASSTYSDFVGSKVYACIGVTCRMHFWQNDRCLLRATAVTRVPNKSQHTKSTLEKKIPPPLLPGLELAIFRPRVRRCTDKLSRLPGSLQYRFIQFFLVLECHLITSAIVQFILRRRVVWCRTQNSERSEEGGRVVVERETQFVTDCG